MLLHHLAELEGNLLAAARGQPAQADPSRLRDTLVETWLEPLFGGELLIEAGELCDTDSLPDAPRPTFDLLLCQRHAPRLRRPGAASVLLAETVVAAIKLVPRLDEAAMAQAVQAARAAKLLKRTALRAVADGPVRDDCPAGSPAGLPGLPCHLLAFDGPDLQTTHRWLKNAYHAAGVTEAQLPLTGLERCAVASPALDGVYVLGQGFLNFDNMPWGFCTDEVRASPFGATWAIGLGERGSLASITLQLQLAATAMAGLRLDPRPYTEAFRMPGLRFGN
jgi:hypothetical protein